LFPTLTSSELAQNGRMEPAFLETFLQGYESSAAGAVPLAGGIKKVGGLI